MKALFGCEESQEMTIAFRELGHIANSCDRQKCSGGHSEWHFQEDIFEVLQRLFLSLDFLGVHPTCKYLANSGVRWLASKKSKHGYEWSDKYQIYINEERYELMKSAAIFFKSMLSYVKSVGVGYVENPILHKYAMEIIREKPTQIIQPWMFGHTTTKATCLWLVGLPKLIPTDIIPKHLRTHEIHECPPGPNREKIRSKTFPLVAKAMAEQWTNFLLHPENVVESNENKQLEFNF